jgi:hypothetical protein
MKYSGVYSSLLPLIKIPALGSGLTMFSEQIATSGVGNRFKPQGLQIALITAIYIISSSMSVFGVSVQRMNLEIMSLQISNTPGRITTYIKRSAMPTPKQPMPNSRRAMFTKDIPYFDIFPVSSATFL